MRGLPAFLSNQWSWPHETTVMDSRSSERKRSSFTTSDILDTMPISLFPQLPPSPTCSDVWQAVSNYDDTPDNVSGHRKEHPSNPSVDADSLRNTEQAVWIAHECQRHTELFLTTLTDGTPPPLPPRTPPTQQIPDPMYDNMEEIQFRATNRQDVELQECPAYTKLPLQSTK